MRPNCADASVQIAKAVVRRPIAKAMLVAVATVWNSAIWAEPQIVELEGGSLYKGVAQQVAFDAGGDAWMVTSEALYRVQGGRPQEVPESRSTNGKSALALLGTGLYARLVRNKVPPGLFTVQLAKVSDTSRLPELRLEDFPFGFGTLYLGGSGELIVTGTPLGDPEGLGGKFLWGFWSVDGTLRSTVELLGRRIGIVEPDGHSILFLGENDAIAFGSDGTELWKVDGAFRLGAIAAKGKVALLSPADPDRVSEVRVFCNGKASTVDAGSPIQNLALSADGSEGAVGVDEGGLHFMSLSSCDAGRCELRKVQLHPFPGTFFITAVRFIDSKTVAIGAIRRIGSESPFKFPEGALLAMETSGKLLLSREIELTQPSTWAPSIDVTYGIRSFAARTPQRTVLVRLDP